MDFKDLFAGMPKVLTETTVKDVLIVKENITEQIDNIKIDNITEKIDHIIEKDNTTERDVTEKDKVMLTETKLTETDNITDEDKIIENENIIAKPNIASVNKSPKLTLDTVVDTKKVVDDADPVDLPVTPEVLYPILEEHGYTVTDKIGSGSFSKVRKATSIKEHQTVAIKLVSKSSAPKDYLEKFLPREIDVVKTLHHDNIIKYYRCIETTRRVYIVMQYAENGSLLDKIRSEGQLGEADARHIYKQLLSALDFCHKQGVVHRDIKCENLLFDRNNVLKLIDFGFARRYHSQSELSRTYCGSYAYACPQILRAIPYDPRFADVWASGVVLYAMVFGRLPFDDSSFSKLIKQVSAKLIFSSKCSKFVGDNCKSILTYILDRSGNRKLSEVKKHAWLAEMSTRITI